MLVSQVHEANYRATMIWRFTVIVVHNSVAQWQKFVPFYRLYALLLEFPIVVVSASSFFFNFSLHAFVIYSSLVFYSHTCTHTLGLTYS